MRALAIAVGLVLFVAAAADAQERCSRTYRGEEHSGPPWEYLTIDATTRGMPRASGITIQNNPTRVCGHNAAMAGGRYCGGNLQVDVDYEWQEVWACGNGGGGGNGDGGGGGGNDGGGNGGGGNGGGGNGGGSSSSDSGSGNGGGDGDGNDGDGNNGGRSDDTANQSVKLSMQDSDSEQVMEGGGPKDVTVVAELTGQPRNQDTHVDVTLDPHEASPDDFETDGENFRIRIPAGQRSASHTFMFKAVDDDEAEPDENLIFTGDTGDAVLPVDPATMTIKDNEPRGPQAADDSAQTPEDEPTLIDVLANDRAPGGNRLRIASAATPEHGTVRVVSDRIAYVPALNYHGSDRFGYTVSDPHGMTATATVQVTVTPVDDAPVAADDAAETIEEEAIVIDVLANDEDADGGRLRVVSVTAPGHGETAVVSGGVRYTPTGNYYGPDAFVYTVSDPTGLTDKATVSLNVLPVNDAPEAVGAIPEQTLEEGGEPLTLDLTSYFTDVDGDALTYAAESSNPAATVVAVSGSTLTLSAVVRGAATVTVTATDPEGLAATQVFGVAVGDRFVREVLTDTLAALGRGHLSSVRQTVGRRLETARGRTPRLSLAGQYFSPLMWNRLGAGGLARTHEWYFRAAMLQQRRASTDLVGTSADPRFRESSGFLGVGSLGGGWDRALLGTNMLLAFGGSDDGPAGSGAGGPRWTVWGQGDLQMFGGSPSDVQDYEGDLRTGYVGVDAQLTRSWLLGVAVARSGGTGMWQRGGSAGELSTALTRVHPYVRWANDDTAVWGVLGVGRGAATNLRTLTGLHEKSDLGLGLGLLEGRRRVATVGGGVDIGLRGEASWARLMTGTGDETIDDLQAAVRRVRAGVELLRAFSAAGGLTVTPFGALSTRHDGGAGQTGVGMEVAGGLRVRNGRVQLEAQGRRLLVHSATAYEEQGVSVAAMVGSSPYEPGLTMSLRPTWGAPGMGAETLWQDQFHTHRQGVAYDAAGIDARLGYGMQLPWGSVLTPFGAYAQREGSGRRFEVGAVMASLGQLPGALDGPLQVEISGERYERPGGRPEHRVGMFGVVNLGGGSALSDTTPAGEPTLDEPTSDSVEVAAVEEPAPLPTAPVRDVVPLARISASVLVATPRPAEAPAAAPRPGSLPRPVAATTPRAGAANGAPVFSAPRYAFVLDLSRPALMTEAPLGAVLARDPEGDPVTYALTSGDGTRFTVDPFSGTVTYVGPFEGVEAGTARHELTVTARDRSRLTQTATVVVAMEVAGGRLRDRSSSEVAAARPIATDGAATVTPRPAATRTAHAAVADAARTYAALPVLIDVLTNDAEVGGLRIVAVTAPAHGTATVTNGMVRYLPESGFSGRDTFTYTVVGDGGRTSRATVTVTVVG